MSKPHKILVCGGRNYKDKSKVHLTLTQYCIDNGFCSDDDYQMPFGITLVHGGAKGADELADAWGVINWIPVIVYKPEWKKYGAGAGPIRNQQMLDKEKPDVVIAFPGGKGTADMIQRAKKAGVKIITVE